MSVTVAQRAFVEANPDLRPAELMAATGLTKRQLQYLRKQLLEARKGEGGQPAPAPAPAPPNPADQASVLSSPAQMMMAMPPAPPDPERPNPPPPAPGGPVFLTEDASDAINGLLGVGQPRKSDAPVPDFLPKRDVKRGRKKGR
jgi:hypothetical protein